METEPLFPELVTDIPVRPPAPCGYPLFLVAYYPRDKRWAIKCPLEFSMELQGMTVIQRAINDLTTRGWTHIHVFSLPNEGPWSAKK